MTKYILHGGGASRTSVDNNNFFSEVVDSLNVDGIILCVYFAREEHLWPTMLEQDKQHFSSVSFQNNIHFVLAERKTDRLVQQIKNADIIYLRGGDCELVRHDPVIDQCGRCAVGFDEFGWIVDEPIRVFTTEEETGRLTFILKEHKDVICLFHGTHHSSFLVARVRQLSLAYCTFSVKQYMV